MMTMQFLAIEISHLNLRKNLARNDSGSVPSPQWKSFSFWKTKVFLFQTCSILRKWEASLIRCCQASWVVSFRLWPRLLVRIFFCCDLQYITTTDDAYRSGKTRRGFEQKNIRSSTMHKGMEHHLLCRRRWTGSAQNWCTHRWSKKLQSSWTEYLTNRADPVVLNDRGRLLASVILKTFHS